MGVAGHHHHEEHFMNATKRILVVDDDPVVGKSIDRVMSPKGYAVITASNGDEALSRIAAEDYDMVYTDIRMPGMDGIEVARRIKASRPWLPVLIVTGYGTEENEVAARAAGVAGFLRKPLAPEAIEDSARGALASPESGWAPLVIKPIARAAEPARKSPWLEVKVFAKNAVLFLGAPLVALFYVLIGPFVALGALAWFGMRALFKR
jgi:CheY-like chemotaxis protein